MQTTFILKIILMGLFFLEVTLFGNLVSRLKCFKNRLVMDLAMTFSGSLFLSIAIMDIIPQAIYHFDLYLGEEKKAKQSKVPLTMIIAMAMFIIIMWLDKIVIGHSHSHDYQEFEDDHKSNKENNVEMRQKENYLQGAHPGTQHTRQQKKSPEDKTSGQTMSWKPFILQAGMSIHAFFQTLAVGLQGSTMSVLSLAAAIIVHKWAQGLTLGLLYKKQGLSTKITTIMIFIQGFVNVLGLITGSFLMGKGSMVMAFFMSLSAGTFLYISLVEVLQQQIKVFSKRKMIMVIAANIFIALIVWLQKQQQSKAQGAK